MSSFFCIYTIVEANNIQWAKPVFIINTVKTVLAVWAEPIWDGHPHTGFIASDNACW